MMKKTLCMLAISLILVVSGACYRKEVHLTDSVKLNLSFDELIRKGNAVFAGEFIEAKQVSDYAFENKFAVKNEIAGTVKDNEVYVYTYFGDLENDMDHFRKGKEYLLAVHYYEQLFREHTLYVLNYEVARSEETGLFAGNDQATAGYHNDEELFQHIKEVFDSVDRTEVVMPPYTVELKIEKLESEGDADFHANTYFVTVEKVYAGEEKTLSELMKVQGYLFAVIEKGLVEPGNHYVLTFRQPDEGSLVFVQDELGKVFLKDSPEANEYLKEKGILQ